MLFPIMVELNHEKIVVVGGGVIALHKIKNLLRFGVNVHVVSPDFHLGIEKLAESQPVFLHRKYVKEADYEDAFLVIAVTNSSEVNDKVAETAKKNGVLVVHTGNPALGNSTIPASLIRGKLVVSVSTGGASPTLAKQIRNKLAEDYDDTYEDYIDFLYEIRQLVKEIAADRSERRLWLKQAAAPLYLEQPEKRASLFAEIKQWHQLN